MSQRPVSFALLLAFVFSPATWAADTKVASGLEACESLECVRQALAPVQKTAQNEADCSRLEGRKADAVSLGFICRLWLARNKAAFRGQAPCKVKTMTENLDWDASLGQTYLRTLYSRLSFASLPKPPVDRLPESYGLHQGPAFGTAVFERRFRSKDSDGNDTEVAYKTFFCLAENPRRHVPYFHAMEVDDTVKSAAAISTPPMANEKILAQIGGDFEPEYVKATEFIDLDGSGVKDVVVLIDHVTEGFRIAACLHDPKKEHCRVLSPTPSLSPERARSAQLSSPRKGDIRLTILGDNAKELGKVYYRLKGDRLEFTKKEGDF